MLCELLANVSSEARVLLARQELRRKLLVKAGKARVRMLRRQLEHACRKHDLAAIRPEAHRTPQDPPVFGPFAPSRMRETGLEGRDR